MRHLVASAIALALFDSVALGDQVLYANQPVDPTQGPNGQLLRDGTFSDSMSSQGTYFYSQAVGQSFRISSEGTQLSRITIWGSSETNSTNPSGITSLDSNIRSLQVTLFRITPGDSYFPEVHSWTIDIGYVTQSRTGTYVPTLLTPVFQLDMSLGNSPSFAAGDYMLSVGANLVNANNAAFVWTDGQRNGNDPTIGNRSYYTVGEIASQWGSWLPVSQGQTSGAMVLYGIPAPGTFALIMMAVAGRRRSRS